MQMQEHMQERVSQLEQKIVQMEAENFALKQRMNNMCILHVQSSSDDEM